MHHYTDEQLNEINRELRYAWHERFNYGKSKVPSTNTGMAAITTGVNTRGSSYNPKPKYNTQR